MMMLCQVQCIKNIRQRVQAKRCYGVICYSVSILANTKHLGRRYSPASDMPSTLISMLNILKLIGYTHLHYYTSTPVILKFRNNTSGVLVEANRVSIFASDPKVEASMNTLYFLK